MIARPHTPLVLVADADPYICRVFEAKLTKDNQYRVASAQTAQEAIMLAIQNEPDGILWDTRLRESERLLPKLRAIAPHAVLILMTTDDVPPSRDEIARLDVADILTKPFGLDTLSESLQQRLNRAYPQHSFACIDISRVGQQITITTPLGHCVTRVLESGLDTFAVVGAPRVETPSDFVPGQKVHVQIQGSDALYEFDTSLLRATDRLLPAWELRMPRTIRRRQRRKHPRLPLRIEILVTVALKETLLAPIQAAVENVGIGGCAFLHKEPLPVGTLVHFQLMAGARNGVTGMAVVLRCDLGMSEKSLHPRPRYRIALQFHPLPVSEVRRLQSLLKG